MPFRGAAEGEVTGRRPCLSSPPSLSLSLCAFTPVNLRRFIGGAGERWSGRGRELSRGPEPHHITPLVHSLFPRRRAGLADCTSCANTYSLFFFSHSFFKKKSFHLFSSFLIDYWKSEEKENLSGLIRAIVKENEIQRRLFLQLTE